MNTISSNCYSTFLEQAKKKQQVISIYLQTGVCLKGMVSSFDEASIVLRGNRGDTLVPRNSIASMVDGEE